MIAPADTGPTSGRPTVPHIPVLLSEVLEALQPVDGGLYIDATFGAGGYSKALLESADCRVIAFDRDKTAINAGQKLVTQFAPRLELIHAPFGTIETELRHRHAPPANGLVFDLGVSSMQVDQPSRGFSFMHDGPLDMRMSGDVADSQMQLSRGGRAQQSPTASSSTTAADVVNTFDEVDLANIIYELGEERRSRAIARAIVDQRATREIQTTMELANMVARVVGRRGHDTKHPATRTFQALRIYVNDELGELRRGLAAAQSVLAPGGRLAVVSFHSLEDRIVKRFMLEKSGKMPGGSRHMPDRSVKLSASCFRIVNSRPLTPSKGELDVNPRARSARLRIAERIMAGPD